jgi:hypothetical protein
LEWIVLMLKIRDTMPDRWGLKIGHESEDIHEWTSCTLIVPQKS